MVKKVKYCFQTNFVLFFFSQKKPAIKKGIKKPKFKSKLKPPPNFGAQVLLRFPDPNFFFVNGSCFYISSL